MKLRAFVFDDDEAVCMWCSAVLQKREYEVYAYPKAQKCPAYLDGGCPCPGGHMCGDIFIVDIYMPSITGIKYIEQLREHRCRVKNFALISGWWSDAELRRAEELGCGILKKPHVLDDLNRWLDSCETNIHPGRKLWGDWFKDKR